MMTSTEQKGFQIVTRFLEALGEAPTEDTLYRGHGDESWKLVPSAFRPDAGGIRKFDDLRRWIQAASKLASPRPSSRLEWLILAQHYGVATPLLDWTRSPLVGLFFAADDAGKEKAGCVWQVRTNSAFEEFAEPSKVDPFLTGRVRPGLIYAASMSPRTTAQDSVMSIHSSPSHRVEPALMRKVFRVEPDEKFYLRQALDRLGFNEAGLFNDLARLAQRFEIDLMMK